MITKEELKDLSLEEAMKKLNDIEKELDFDNVNIDEAISKFEEAKLYYEVCQEKLEEIKSQVEEIAGTE